MLLLPHFMLLCPYVLQVRPRGWHLWEKHVLVDGRPVPGGIFDFALFFFHCARPLLDRGSGAQPASCGWLSLTMPSSFTGGAPCLTADRIGSRHPLEGLVCRAHVRTSCHPLFGVPEHLVTASTGGVYVAAGPYFYLPKMQSHLEARLWNSVFVDAQVRPGMLYSM